MSATIETVDECEIARMVISTMQRRPEDGTKTGDLPIPQPLRHELITPPSFMGALPNMMQYYDVEQVQRIA